MSSFGKVKWIAFLIVLISAIQLSSAAGWIRINPIEGTVGSNFWVRGGGFVPDSKVGLMFGDQIIGIITTDRSGSISVRLEVPEISCGKHKVLAIDEVKNNAYVLFNVTPKITRVYPNDGRPGSAITITGKGFSANSNIKVRFVNLFEITGMLQENIISEKMARTNEKGTFEIKFEIPEVNPGYYLIYAYDPDCGIETGYTNFEVLEPKSTPTPTPTPKTPKTTPVQNELAQPSEAGETAPQTTPKTPTTKTTKSTPGFEALIAIGGIATAILVSIRRK